MKLCDICVIKMKIIIYIGLSNFRGGAARFSFFSGGLWLLVLFLVVFFFGLFPFGNKFLLIQKINNYIHWVV